MKKEKKIFTVDQLINMKVQKNKDLQDCIYTKEELDVDAEIQLEDFKKLDIESTIKKLDIWDTQHLIEKKSNILTKFKTFIESNIGNLKERWAKNRRKSETSKSRENNLHNSINNSNSKLLSSNKKNNKLHDLLTGKNNKNIHEDLHNSQNQIEDHLPNFLDSDEKDQICILLQNINIFRKKFDFNIFIKSTEIKKSNPNFNNNLTTFMDQTKPTLEKTKIHINKENSNNEDENKLKIVNRTIHSTINVNSQSIGDSFLNIKNSLKINTSNLPNLNSFDNKNNALNINNYNNPSKTIETEANLNKKCLKPRKINNTNTTQSLFLNTERNCKDSSFAKIADENKNIFISENYDDNKETHLKQKIDNKKYKTQENFYKPNGNLTTIGNKNLFLNENSYENNLTKFQSVKNSDIIFKNKFKIPIEIKAENTYERKANIANDNYMNKSYLKSLIESKKELQVSEDIIYLNNGSVLKIKKNEDENISKNFFYNYNAFSILNNKITNSTRLATSYDLKKPQLNLKDNNSNHEVNLNTYWKDNLTTKNNVNKKYPFNNKDLIENQNLINLNNFNLLNNKIYKFDEEKILNEKEYVNKITTGDNKNNNMIGKDGNLKYYQSLMDKYLILKDKKEFEKLDNVDYYKKIIREKVEKENIVRKEY